MRHLERAFQAEEGGVKSSKDERKDCNQGVLEAVSTAGTLNKSGTQVEK